MFRFRISLALLMLLFLFLGLVWQLIEVTEGDVEAYQQLVRSSSSPEMTTSRSLDPCGQERQGVWRTFFLAQGEQRLQLFLKSRESELTLTKEDEGIEAVECFREIECCKQERLFEVLVEGKEEADPFQEVSYLQAKKAKYFYKTNRLVAEDVKLVRFKAPGHRLSDEVSLSDIVFEGEAESLEILLFHIPIHFQAKKLHATVPHELAFEADTVLCDGEKMLLQGNPRIVTAFGDGTADEMVFERSFHHNDAVSHFEMKGHVVAFFDSGLFGKQDVRDEIRADHALYKRKELEHLLTFQGNVLMKCGKEIVLKAEKEVQITQEAWNNSRALKSIVSHGKTRLEYLGEGKAHAHVLTCYGGVNLDHHRLHAILESPCDVGGEVKRGLQVHFEDAMGEVYADRVVLECQRIEEKVEPNRLIMEGDIRICDRCGKVSEEESAFFQCALADTVEYSFQKKEMSLFAKDKGRVLFYDKLNKTQVSAPALRIVRDRNTKEELIQGLGDVRFTFAEKEFESLRERFYLEGKGARDE